MVRWKPGIHIEELLAGAVESDIHLFGADVIKAFDTVDRSILDRVLSCLGLPDWFRHSYHAHVRLRVYACFGAW